MLAPKRGDAAGGLEPEPSFSLSVYVDPFRISTSREKSITSESYPPEGHGIRWALIVSIVLYDTAIGTIANYVRVPTVRVT